MKKQIAASLLTFLFLSSNPLLAYNSDEHKIIGDRGMALVKFPASIKLPKTIIFQEMKPFYYLDSFKKAKALAVGFSSNNPKQYSSLKKGVQDNYYVKGRIEDFKQKDFNMNIHIPSPAVGPRRWTYLTMANGNNQYVMTFGDLVAFYGDYRMSVFNDDSGKCYLTSGPSPRINFRHGTAQYATLKPNSVSTGEYLRYIASGLVPPFGKWLNATSNTSRKDEFDTAGWWGDQLTRLLRINDWHFSESAVAWYVGMHRMAIHCAGKAAEDNKYWSVALNYEANALHSLTDLFAFGHVVVNRNYTSHQLVRHNGNTKHPSYVYLVNALTMGGLSGNGKLSTSLPPLRVKKCPQNEVFETGGGEPIGLVRLGNLSKNENKYHDLFNSGVTTVRNLNKDTFKINGDGGYYKLPTTSQRIMDNAVKASIDSLIDAYFKMKSGTLSADQYCQKHKAKAFKALKYIPIYVESDPDSYFLGKWTRYAKFANDLTNSTIVPSDWEKCKMPLIHGNTKLPPKQTKKCCEFEAEKTQVETGTGSFHTKFDNTYSLEEGKKGKYPTVSVILRGRANDVLNYELTICHPEKVVVLHKKESKPFNTKYDIVINPFKGALVVPSKSAGRYSYEIKLRCDNSHCIAFLDNRDPVTKQFKTYTKSGSFTVRKKSNVYEIHRQNKQNYEYWSEKKRLKERKQLERRGQFGR